MSPVMTPRCCRVCSAPAAALYVHSSGFVAPLCSPCLDCWLDGADDDPALEPSDLRFFPAETQP